MAHVLEAPPGLSVARSVGSHDEYSEKKRKWKREREIERKKERERKMERQWTDGQSVDSGNVLKQHGERA